MIGQGDFEDAIRAGQAIEGHDLSRIDWDDLPSGRIVIRDCTLHNASLAGAELGEAVFEGVTFGNCGLAGADLVNARFTQCVFFDSEARKGCDFADAQMRGASFIECNLSMCRFAGANLHTVHMQGCKASGADFEDASFVRKSGRTSVTAGKLIDCALDFANFRNLTLEDCDFAGSSLRQADFSRSNLGKAGFQRTDLTSAIFAGAELAEADLRGATITGMDLARVKGFAGIKVNEGQLSALVGPFGMRVFPD